MSVRTASGSRQPFSFAKKAMFVSERDIAHSGLTSSLGKMYFPSLYAAMALNDHSKETHGADTIVTRLEGLRMLGISRLTMIGPTMLLPIVEDALG